MPSASRSSSTFFAEASIDRIAHRRRRWRRPGCRAGRGMDWRARRPPFPSRSAPSPRQVCQYVPSVPPRALASSASPLCAGEKQVAAGDECPRTLVTQFVGHRLQVGHPELPPADVHAAEQRDIAVTRRRAGATPGRALPRSPRPRTACGRSPRAARPRTSLRTVVRVPSAPSPSRFDNGARRAPPPAANG